MRGWYDDGRGTTEPKGEGGVEVVGPGGFGAAFGTIFAFGLLLTVGHFVGLVAAMVSIFQRSDLQVVGDSRVLWALVVLFIPFAWAAYFLMGRR